ncbi:MAG: hypothetical protein AAGN66_02925 [Acidobacteriota bacterium]
MPSRGIVYMIVAVIFAGYVVLRPDLQGFRSIEVVRIFVAGIATGVLLANGWAHLRARRRGR